ncbi:MAG: TonB-dependent receptor domain-containing protein [bacterium]
MRPLRYLVLFGLVGLLTFNSYGQEFASKSVDRSILKRSIQEFVTLGEALSKLEKTYKVHFVYEDAVVKGILVPRLATASKNLREDLRVVLAENSLTYKHIGARTIVLVPREPNSMKPRPQERMTKVSGVITDARSGDPLPGANVSVQGTLIGAAARNDGSYSLNLQPGSYTLLVQFIGYKTIKEPIKVVGDQSMRRNFSLEDDVLELSEVVAIGTRRQGRTVVESPVPIDVLTARDIESTGVTQTTQILQLLIPSYNAPRPSITDGSDSMRPATLRGLGPDQVLILVNGKRRHTSALVHVNGSIGRGSTGVDLNAIPANAIEKIEVLRDGAAAQYGSDAIAGVINIVLKERRGLDTSVKFSENVSSVTRGYRADEGNFADNSDANNYSWDGAGAIGGPQDRNYTDGKTADLHLGYGFAVKQEGTVYVSAQLRHRDRAVRAGLDPRQQFFDGDPREATFDRLNHVFGNGEFDDVSVFYNGSVPIDDKGSKLYAFGGYNRRTGSTGCFYRRALDNRTVRSIHPEGFLPTLNNTLNDFSSAGGVKGSVGPWTYDVSETYGRDSFRFGVHNTNNASEGNSSKTKFNSGTLKFQQATTNVDLLRAVDIGTAAPLTIAIGGEFRWENYKIDPGEVDSYLNGGVPVLDGPNAGKPAPVGASCFPGFSQRNATDESRTNLGFYVDLENNITDQLLLGVAGRFEDYSDFGSTLTGKIDGRYEFTEGFAIRGAVSSGFRAPSLAQAHYSAIATNFIDGVPFEVGTFPVDDPVARALGARDLDSETSVNLSGGFTVSQENFSLTADAYKITINDRIVFTENFTGSGIADFLQSQGIDANGGRYFTNAVNTRTYGLDLIARYGVVLGPGTFRFTAALNFGKTEITNKDQILTPEVLKNFTSKPLFGRTEQGRFEHGQPRQKYNLTANYDIKAWGFLVRTQRYGAVTSFNSSDPDPVTGINLRDQTFGAKWLTDVEVSYKLPRGAAVSVGADNIFDIYPDKNLKRNSFNGIFPYNGLSPFGFFGRSIYGRLDFSLR